MDQYEQNISVHSPDGMATVGRTLAKQLGAGKTIALNGPLGAGKSTLARAIILESLPVPEDVPSPTFTLVQTYERPDFDIWHCDLYRLTAVDQVDELGLWDAFDSAACLIEWPDILGDYLPPSALRLTIVPDTTSDLRLLKLCGPAADWADLGTVLNDAYD